MENNGTRSNGTSFNPLLNHLFIDDIIVYTKMYQTKTAIALDIEGFLVNNIYDRKWIAEGIVYLELIKRQSPDHDLWLFSNATINQEEAISASIWLSKVVGIFTGFISVEDQINALKHKTGIDLFNNYNISPNSDYLNIYNDKRMALLLFGDILFKDYNNVILIDDSFPETTITIGLKTYQIKKFYPPDWVNNG